MATHLLNLPAQRVGQIKGEMMAHAAPHEVLSIGMDPKKMPRNGGKEIIYRRYLPYGATTTNANSLNRWTVDALAHLTQEGVTPTAERMEKHDVSAFMQQYSCLYATSDQALDLGEDGAELPGELKMMVGERMGLVREMVRYSALKACTNVLYAGGTTRLTVDEKIGQTVVRKAVRSLEANHAKKRTMILAPGTAFNTSGVQPAYFGFAHTDVRGDIEDLPGFKHVHEYATRKAVHDNEIGEAGGHAGDVAVAAAVVELVDALDHLAQQLLQAEEAGAAARTLLGDGEDLGLGLVEQLLGVLALRIERLGGDLVIARGEEPPSVGRVHETGDGVDGERRAVLSARDPQNMPLSHWPPPRRSTPASSQPWPRSPAIRRSLSLGL